MVALHLRPCHSRRRRSGFEGLTDVAMKTQREIVLSASSHIGSGRLPKRAAGLLAVAILIAMATWVAPARCDDAPAKQLLPVHTGGRVQVGANGDSWDYGWPGVYFEARFTGTAVDVHLNDYQNTLAISVDGQEVARLQRPGKTTYEVRDLPDGAHTIRLVKTTESYSEYASFNGFAIPAGATALPPPSRPFQMEFIGDSETIGLSNLSTQRQCESAEIVDKTDSEKSFAVLTAHHYNADYQLVAMSSRGLLRNYGGLDPSNNMQTYYDRLFPYVTEGKYQRPADWAPQVVVISLGTNDFSVDVKPEEPWPNKAALRAAYVDSYVGFVARLRALDPHAVFALAATGGYVDAVRSVVERVKASGDARVVFVEFAGLTLQGCNYHPNAQDHETMSGALISAIDGFGDAWGREKSEPLN